MPWGPESRSEAETWATEVPISAPSGTVASYVLDMKKGTLSFTSEWWREKEEKEIMNNLYCVFTEYTIYCHALNNLVFPFHKKKTQPIIEVNVKGFYLF